MAEKEDEKTRGPNIPKILQTRNFGMCGIEDVCLKAEYTLNIRKIS